MISEGDQHILSIYFANLEELFWDVGRCIDTLLIGGMTNYTLLLRQLFLLLYT